ncbi:SGNH/GDSL hydrolase family protein [Rhodohalobacter mucosus]|uniref:Lipase n=1 Tax=Rhodohalobacter mucosus TaxID=2079485 RepID=A0A316TXE5_9BACT|nr:SGNH/GDSL hydrolase family protein [Rhodohalobacter mucosus]PWN07322.1 lipase [Rhodohalobacter mucosus]
MITTLIDLLLAPVYFYQGKFVRDHIVMLPEPEGERKGIIGSGKQISLLVVGDSSAAGVGTSSQEEALLGNILTNLDDIFEISYCLLAKTGARTRHVITRLKRQPEKSYELAVTALGVNDVTAGLSQKEWISDQRELYGVLREKFRVEHILVSGLPPVSEFPALPQPLRWFLGRSARTFNTALEHLCEEEGCHYIPPDDVNADVSMMASDGFHPGPGVYKAWGREIARTIRLVRDQSAQG